MKEQRKYFENEIIRNGYNLVTTSYVILETITLLQFRVGLNAVKDWRNIVEPLIYIHWVDKALHEKALEHLLSGKNKNISLVDWTSFLFIEKYKINKIFTFDKHFKNYFANKGVEIL